MPSLKINDRTVDVPSGTLLIDACAKAGAEVPRYCYHPCLRAAGTCRMCVVEVMGNHKLVTSCSKEAHDGMEVRTDTPAVIQARASVMEFMLLNHPLDCPICDKSGECKLQDYAYLYGRTDGRTEESKSRFAYENLGTKIAMDKNRCVHCTRCVRFLQDVTGTCEMAPTHRGAALEISAFDGRTLDANPFAGNLVELCPVGALTARGFRFSKRAWYLKPVPTISRHGADAKPIWADVDRNRVWRFRTRPEGNDSPTRFISDEERGAFARYALDPAKRLRHPVLDGRTAPPEALAERLGAGAPVAVVAQGSFGSGALEALAGLATHSALRHAHGNRRLPVQNAAIQRSDDAVINRAGAAALGYRFDGLGELLSDVESGNVKSVVLYHDSWFSDEAENAVLEKLLHAAPFSLLLEPVPSALALLAKALLPVTTYLEESDTITDHGGAVRGYTKALQPPRGVLTPAAWARELAAVPVG